MFDDDDDKKKQIEFATKFSNIVASLTNTKSTARDDLKYKIIVAKLTTLTNLGG